MSLDASSCAAAISDAFIEAAAGGFHADFAKAYDAYAKKGLALGVVNTGGDASIIELALASTGPLEPSVDILANGLAGYWATVGLSGDGAHGGAPVSVVNNAMTLVPAFAAAITASIDPSAESKPYFEKFILNIEAVVKTIIWTVIEAMPPLATPTPFPEMMS